MGCEGIAIILVQMPDLAELSPLSVVHVHLLVLLYAYCIVAVAVAVLVLANDPMPFGQVQERHPTRQIQQRQLRHTVPQCRDGAKPGR